MTQTSNAGKPEQDQGKRNEKTFLEKVAELIDPPGREITDDELLDPGANIPDSDSGDTARKTPDRK
jgi:hypothetical protein